MNFSGEEKPISPYIYGINDGASFKKVSPKSIRFGGNRTTGYNWENNKSNAGTDWYNQTDDYLIRNVRSNLKQKPAAAALNVSQDAVENNVPYTLLTLPMAGYVAKTDGQKSVGDGPRLGDWCKVVNKKGRPLSLTPDLKDDYVYIDEYLNYLGKTIGNSKSNSGFKGYALDNEPALWEHTHPVIHNNSVEAEELIAKSIDLAKTVKDFDKDADVFGPALFGYSAYDSLGVDWDLIQAENSNRFKWFIEYYLDQMAIAEEETGTRLLDVLDLHYYTEAKGACGIRTCDHYNDDYCIRARIDSVRSLYDYRYRENSWIVDAGARHFPLLPKLYESIENYYPGTKLAFTEYNFGGGSHISGAIAQADFLGILAQYQVYFASIWAFEKADYQFAAINMYTNYDSNGGYFADTLLDAFSSDDHAVSVYAGKNASDGKTHIILINKEIHEATKVNVNLSDSKFTQAQKYVLDGSSTAIKKVDEAVKIQDGTMTLVLEPLTINHFVLE